MVLFLVLPEPVCSIVRFIAIWIRAFKLFLADIMFPHLMATEIGTVVRSIIATLKTPAIKTRRVIIITTSGAGSRSSGAGSRSSRAGSRSGRSGRNRI